MKKNTIALLSVGAVCILASGRYAIQKTPNESQFETQSVRSDKSQKSTSLSIISYSEDGSRGGSDINSIPCADIDGDGKGDIRFKYNGIDNWDIFKSSQAYRNCECIHESFPVGYDGKSSPYIQVNGKWLLLNTVNLQTFCPEGVFLGNNHFTELLGHCNDEVSHFGWGMNGIITDSVALNDLNDLCIGTCGDGFNSPDEECDGSAKYFFLCNQNETCAPAGSKNACTCQTEIIKEPIPSNPTKGNDMLIK